VVHSKQVLVTLQATAWVKREAEKEQRQQVQSPPPAALMASNETSNTSPAKGLRLPKWLGFRGGSVLSRATVADVVAGVVFGQATATDSVQQKRCSRNVKAVWGQALQPVNKC
jgi:hypothetical protein